MPLGIEEFTIKECVSIVLPKEQKRGGASWDEKGRLRPLQWLLLKAGEGPERRLKVKRPLQCLLGMRLSLCPATMLIT